MIYCDTSLLVSALTSEAMSDAVRAWLAAQDAKTLAISWWVDVEIESALAAKWRAKDLNDEQRQQAIRTWRLVRGGIVVEGVKQHHFARAAELVNKSSGLRASDALHLAIVEERGWRLATLDRGLTRAAHEAAIEVCSMGG